ncbi:hypothetical protein BCT58_18190 [Vibrio lentus]|nr:hypothetical protein BCT58_18190 [Vibrio lentus]
MPCKFNIILANSMRKRNISRNELIELLYKEREFQQLDHVTLSRWITGKTTPSLYKQVLIMKILNISLLSFITDISYSPKSVPNKYSSVLDKFKQSFGIVTPMLSYNDLTSPLEYRLDTQNCYEHFHIFNAFYNNIEPLKQLAKELMTLGNELTYECIVLKNSVGHIIGHYSQIVDIENINNSSTFTSIPIKDVAKSTLAIMGCYSNEEQFIGLLVHALTQMSIHHFNKKEYIYIYVTGTMSQEIMTSIFHGEIIKTYTQNNDGSSILVSLIKINFIKALVNPFLFIRIREKIIRMQECTLGHQLKHHCKLKEKQTTN